VGLLGGEAARLRLALGGGTGTQIEEGEWEGKRRRDELEGVAIEGTKGSAEGFVAAEDLVEAGVQSREVEGSLDGDGSRNQVGGVAGGELVQEPKPLLRVRERKPLGLTRFSAQKPREERSPFFR
jgi:hypothetical protein